MVIVESFVHRLSTMACVLVLLGGCTAQNMNNSLNDYIDAKGRDYLAQNSGAVCCIVTVASDLYWDHTDQTAIDIYSKKSVIFGESYWKRGHHSLGICRNSVEAAEMAVQAQVG